MCESIITSHYLIVFFHRLLYNIGMKQILIGGVILGLMTSCEMGTTGLFEPVAYQLTRQEIEAAQARLHTIIDQTTYAAFEYSDKLSGCDFAPGEYEAAEKQYHIRLGTDELAKLKHMLKRVWVVGAVQNGHEAPKEAIHHQPETHHFFKLYLYNDKQILATVYPHIEFDTRSPKVNYIWYNDQRAELKALPSYALYEQREAAAQREYAEQQQAFENED